ncbi:hypothetical protein [Serratia sp. PL7]|uniref:hypothetical protein n=1 Tax=Serratia sp. PL7 TaxID=2952201 RepID=UPI0021ADA502|nr:hypothetical protein [Serratia sp. PL7]
MYRNVPSFVVFHEKCQPNLTVYNGWAGITDFYGGRAMGALWQRCRAIITLPWSWQPPARNMAVFAGGMYARYAKPARLRCIFPDRLCSAASVAVFITPVRVKNHRAILEVTTMKPKHLAEIAAASIRVNGGSVSSFECRELARLIIRSAENRERFIQKIRAPAYEWKKPAPRRRAAK